MRILENFSGGVTHFNFDNGLTVRMTVSQLPQEQTQVNCNTYRRSPRTGKFISEIVHDECINLTADALVDHLYMISRRKPITKEIKTFMRQLRKVA